MSTKDFSSLKERILNGLAEYSSKIKWHIFLLISLYTAGEWIELFGKNNKLKLI